MAIRVIDVQARQRARSDPGLRGLLDLQHVGLTTITSVKVAHTMIVILNLSAVSSGDRIWTIQSTCFEKTSMSDTLLEEANAIVKQLGIDELI